MRANSNFTTSYGNECIGLFLLNLSELKNVLDPHQAKFNRSDRSGHAHRTPNNIAFETRYIKNSEFPHLMAAISPSMNDSLGSFRSVWSQWDDERSLNPWAEARYVCEIVKYFDTPSRLESLHTIWDLISHVFHSHRAVKVFDEVVLSINCLNEYRLHT